MMTSLDIKKVAKSLSGLISAYLLIKGAASKEEADKALGLDLTSYMMYLSVSDGQVLQSEANKISEYMSSPITPESINNIVRKMNIYSTKFEQMVPLSLMVLVQIDNESWDNGDGNYCFADALVELFETVGCELIGADGDIDATEMSDMRTYINMMNDYIMQNDKIKIYGDTHGDTYKKESRSYNKSLMKTGVSAPRKR